MFSCWLVLWEPPRPASLKVSPKVSECPVMSGVQPSF
ncbi:hypothetical protein GBAR_LOCUS22808 [Geodia barretti]|uniref:Uncharacterized protein n=1 Tax=Geodia barretti TaxID=519541 RepID=A0AA35T3E3_GEOBA|nr:hypothetical protein GBAR_LOCUS22808 [Geodia barretti]